MKIITKLVVSNIIIIAIIGFIFAITAQSTTKNFLIEDIKLNSEGDIDSISRLVSLFLDISRERIERISSDPGILNALKTGNEGDLKKVSDILTSVQKSRANFEGIGLHNVNGISVASDESSKKVIGANFAHRDYHKGVMETGLTYVSGSFKSAATGNLVLAIASPVKDDKNKILGYAVGVVDLGLLFDSLKEEREGRHIVLLDRYGTVIVESEDRHGEHEEVIEIVNQKIQKGAVKDFFEQDTEGELEYLAFKKYSEFAVVLDRDARAVFSVSDKITESMLIFAAAGSIIMIILISLVSISIANPIKTLTGDIDKITKGEFEIELGSSGTYEIQKLIDSLNRVLTSLKLAIARGVTKKKIGVIDEKPEEKFIKALSLMNKEEKK